MANNHGISQKVVEHLPLVKDENMFNKGVYMVTEMAYIKGYENNEVTFPPHPVGVMGRDEIGNRIYICNLIKSADNDFEAGTLHGMFPDSKIRGANIVDIRGYLPLVFK